MQLRFYYMLPLAMLAWLCLATGATVVITGPVFTPTGGAADPPIITGQVINVLRNNFDGSLGFKFTVGGTGITVTALGRWVVSGNSQTHVLRLFDVTGPTQLASVTIATSGATAAAYKYGNITPTALSAAGVYAVLADEINAGDQFDDTDGVTANAAITVNNSAYRSGLSGGSGAINTGAAGSRSYGPCNFLYH